MAHCMDVGWDIWWQKEALELDWRGFGGWVIVISLRSITVSLLFGVAGRRGHLKAIFNPTFICYAPSSIASNFQSWWVSLNLPACTCANNGWLVPGTGNDAIEINKLQVPGKNGWLSLLFILMIWGCSISTGDTTEWDLAVIDVNWVTYWLIGTICTGPALRTSQLSKGEYYLYIPVISPHTCILTIVSLTGHTWWWELMKKGAVESDPRSNPSSIMYELPCTLYGFVVHLLVSDMT